MLNIVDLHCDTLSQMLKLQQPLLSNRLHFDILRAKKSGIKIQFMALFAHPGNADLCLRKILLQVSKFKKSLEENSSLIYQVKDHVQIDEDKMLDKIGCILHLEGGEALGEDVELLYLLHSIGLRSMGLTWNPPNLLAGGVDADTDREGLTTLGRTFIRAMEDLGIILDLAHMCPRSFFEALECYNKPIMVTHSNAYTICPSRRNLSDSQLKAVAENGGVIGFTQVSDFVCSEGMPGIDDFLDHICYAADLIGVEYLALGSDFDGAEKIVLPGVEAYLELPQLLEKRGFNRKEIALILSENAFRVMKEII